MFGVKLLITFASLITIASSRCPSVCKCNDTEVICSSKDIECIPSFESLDNTPLVIDLSGNSINIVEPRDFSFDASRYVQELYLNDSSIVTIENNAFLEMTNLQQLYLSNNLLKEIPDTLFLTNTVLVLLDLSGNQFFKRMPKITSTSLEVLALANSKIGEVPNDALDNLPNIKLLILQQNHIKYISPDVFQNAKNLYFVSIAQNAWECNCRTIDMFNYLANKNLTDPAEPLNCLTEAKTFLNVYENGGIISKYKDKCGLNSPRDQVFSEFFIDVEKENANFEQSPDLIEVDEKDPVTNDIGINSFECYSTLNTTLSFVIIIIVFSFGLIFGYLIGRRNGYHVVPTDSKTKLIIT